MVEIPRQLSEVSYFFANRDAIKIQYDPKKGEHQIIAILNAFFICRETGVPVELNFNGELYKINSQTLATIVDEYIKHKW